MKKRYKLIEIPKPCCKNQECHITEYHDGYTDCDILCKINNEVCNEENCNHKELQLEGYTKEEMIEKIAKAMFEWQRPGCRGDVPIEDVWQNEKCGFENLAKAALDALLEGK